MHAPATHTRGMSLVELTLAMAMLVTLSMVLFGFLRTGMGLYKQGEGRRDIYERAQILLDQLVRDLDGIAATERLPGVPPVERLIGDRDDAGRPRLRFVRSLGTETVDPVLREASTNAGATAYVDLVDDTAEANAGTLRAPGGRMEIVYLTTRPRPKSSDRSGEGETWLLRGIRSPIGGEGSYFVDDNLPRGSREPIPSLRPLTSGVLHLGFRYRGIGNDGTRQWFDVWDSTRGRVSEFDRFVGSESIADSGDDVFPSGVEIELVLEEPGRGRVFLTRPISEGSGSLSVNATSLLDLGGDEGWVRIDDEWILVEEKSSTVFKVIDRGGRGTTEAAHDARARVKAGSRFRRVVPVAVGAEAWQ